MIKVQNYQSVFALGLIISFFVPWGQAGDWYGSGYDIALQLGGHFSVLLLILVVAVEPFLQNIVKTEKLAFKIVAGIFSCFVFLAIISHGEIGSILLFIPVMAFELLVKALMGEKPKLQSAVFGLSVLSILGFGVIYLSGKGMNYVAIVQCASVGFYASVALSFAMLLYGGKWISTTARSN